MNTRNTWKTKLATAAAAALVAFSMTAPEVFAHCDTMDGPVVRAAERALEGKNVTPVLKWVPPRDEAEVRVAFKKVLAVRELGADARSLADTSFFETVVRLHRAGEGAPYTGLKPAGTDPGPVVNAADRALESGSVDGLARKLSQEVAAGIRGRFAAAQKAKAASERSVEAGREYVRAYVHFVHYAEGVHAVAGAKGGHSEEKPHAEAAAAGGDGHRCPSSAAR